MADKVAAACEWTRAKAHGFAERGKPLDGVLVAAVLCSTLKTETDKALEAKEDAVWRAKIAGVKPAELAELLDVSAAYIYQMVNRAQARHE